MGKFIRAVLFALLLTPLWAVASEPININTADATMLEKLKGIGPAKAAAIIEYREQHGPFVSTADLSLVPGIGAKTVEMIESEITASAD